MNGWLIADMMLLLSIVPCALVALRGHRVDDFLPSLQRAGIVAFFALMVWAQATHRPSSFALSLCVSLLAYPGAVLFAQAMERWLR